MDQEIQAKLKNVFLKIFPMLDAKTFHLDMRRQEFENWDSLAHLQLIAEIETAFRIQFAMDEIIDIDKPSDFLKTIEKKAKHDG